MTQSTFTRSHSACAVSPFRSVLLSLTLTLGADAYSKMRGHAPYSIERNRTQHTILFITHHSLSQQDLPKHTVLSINTHELSQQHLTKHMCSANFHNTHSSFHQYLTQHLIFSGGETNRATSSVGKHPRGHP